MAYEIYQKHGENWVKISDPTSLINDTLTSSTTTWSSLEMKSRFEALAGNLKVEIVTERPATGVLNTMYYVGTETPYHIWLYANNTEGVATWFDMGTTGISLTNYYTKTEVDTKIGNVYTKAQADAKYLPLTGGTVSGAIKSSVTSGGTFKMTMDNGYLEFDGGTSYQSGHFALYGKNHNALPGACVFTGHNGTQWYQLNVLPATRPYVTSSTFTGNKSLMYTDEAYTKTEADSKYLPLAGGTMSGTITTSVGFALRSNVDNGGLQILGSTAARSGARLVLEGKNSGATGAFTLEAAKSSTEYTQLVGRTGGTLTWGGNTVMTNDVTYTKTEVDTSLATKQKNITYGTSEPSGGVDGDIYIRYEE